MINTSAEQDLDLALQLVKKAGRRLSSYGRGSCLDAPPHEVMPKIAQLATVHVAKGDPGGAIEWVRSMKNAAHETMARMALNVLPTESES